MSRRPRLVEEGEPITAYARDVEKSMTNMLPDVVDDHRSKESSRSRGLPFSGTDGGSSLQRAAGGIPSFTKRRSKEGKLTTTVVKTETSFVVGGGDCVTNSTLQGSQQFQDQFQDDGNNFHVETSMTITGPTTAPCDLQQQHQLRYSSPYQTSPHNHLPSSYYHQMHHGDHLVDDDYEMDSHGSHHMEDDLSHPTTFIHNNSSHRLPLISASLSSAVSKTTTSTTTTGSKNPVIRTTPIITSYVVGEMEAEGISPLDDDDDDDDNRPMKQMEGVEDLGRKMPLVVLDGANVAHHYAQAMSQLHKSSSSSSSVVTKSGKSEPDARGIQVATDHFLQAGLRVLVVLPQYWFKVKPRSGDRAINHSYNNTLVETQQLEILNDLKAKGLLVISPPTDDDDAYALTIARREEIRSLSKRNGEGPGFVVSNDLFRDAQDRDRTGVLRQWLTHGRHDTVGPGRISYTFGEMGTMNDRGEQILDFIPNPRHPLIIWMEGQHFHSHPYCY